MISIDIKEASEIFDELIEKVIFGEQVFITQNSEPIAKLVPFKKTNKTSQQRIKAASAKGLIEISDDFDEPLADFKNYME
jgi:prevent-host-death family protein